MEPTTNPAHGREASKHTVIGAGRTDFGVSGFRLMGREWLATGLIVLLVFDVVPRIWDRYEPLDATINYRVPYARSDDYWTYERWNKRAVQDDRIPVLGDSFVWGEYVDPERSLSADLNAQTGTSRFANFGLNGAHPLALQGLVRNYWSNLTGRHVILHCNLLWMSSPERDLRTDKDTAFNHPHLVPQFDFRIKAYQAPLSQRLGNVVNHHVPFLRFVDHLRTCCFDGLDVHTWSLSHPYDNPLKQLLLSPLVENSAASRHTPVSWVKQGIKPQDWPWVDLETSLQWQAWRETVQQLGRNGNSVLAVIGPLNEHLLTPASRRRYAKVKEQVAAWLHSQKIRCIEADLLPSEEYGDASHPLNTGYTRLVKSLSSSREFQDWFNGK